jgi:hypothetical protein
MAMKMRQTEQGALDLAEVNDRVNRSESTQIEMGSKMNLIENQLGVLNQQQANTSMQVDEIYHQTLAHG